MATENPPGTIVVTATAPVNIAVIKYWGKRDTSLILPINSSLSATIDPNTMCSTTTIAASKEFKDHSMTLNGEEVPVITNKRLANVMAALLAKAQDRSDENGNVIVPKGEWKDYKLKITSHNNFPTAAGLASSASGYACFTKCLAQLYCVAETPQELSAVARQGSGSACRSLEGGFVKWNMGEKDDGTDSFAEQVVDEKHWPELRVMILVVCKTEKETPSTAGMQTSIETSDLLKQRISVVPQRMEQMETFLKEKNFEEFAKLTMRDSNQFHATCLDTYPPLFYMNATSRAIISAVHKINEEAKEIILGYTFDAGPNAVLFCQSDAHLERFMNVFVNLFKPPQIDLDSFVHDPLSLWDPSKIDVKAAEGDFGRTGIYRNDAHTLSRIIVSQVGEGAAVQNDQVVA